MKIQHHPEGYPIRNSIYDHDIVGHGWGEIVDTTLAIVHLECFLEGRLIPTDGCDLPHPGDYTPGGGKAEWWSKVTRTGRTYATFVGYTEYEDARRFPSTKIVQKWIDELGEVFGFAELYN